MKVIFLDCDGELTYMNYHCNDTKDIDLNKVKLLKEICDKTNAKVVIISSWRLEQDWYETLVNILSDNGIDVIDKTSYIRPDLLDYDNIFDDYNTNIKYGTGRGAEVQEWLNEHDIESFVILDDEDWNWKDYGYENIWIQPSYFDGGLKKEHVDKAIEILNG